jgi:hypothetical protein
MEIASTISRCRPCNLARTRSASTPFIARPPRRGEATDAVDRDVHARLRRRRLSSAGSGRWRAPRGRAARPRCGASCWPAASPTTSDILGAEAVAGKLRPATPRRIGELLEQTAICARVAAVCSRISPPRRPDPPRGNLFLYAPRCNVTANRVQSWVRATMTLEAQNREDCNVSQCCGELLVGDAHQHEHVP